MRWNSFNNPCLPMGKDGRRVTASSDHIALARKVAGEGAVLLKNTDSALPLSGIVALFGKGVADYVKGGGGSGDVTCKWVHSILDGLCEKEKEGKISICLPLAEYYRSYVHSEYEKGGNPGLVAEPAFPEKEARNAAAAGAKALIVISRFSGESWDRAADGSPIFSEEDNGRSLLEKEAEIFEHGDFYLSDKERQMVDSVLSIFGSAVVALNVGGMIDVSWIADDDRIKGAVQFFQGGMTGGDAAADILTGDVNPSGRLTDTYASSLDDYPSSATFHDSMEYVEYSDDIFVGYRYFWTIPGAEKKIVYPFGYGLSYTTFALKIIEAKYENGEVGVVVEVENTGTISGKDVIELYTMLPHGSLDKPCRVLSAFAKTGNLKPGKTERVALRFLLSSISEYDEEGVISEASWVLEKGVYEIQLTDDATTFRRILSITLKENEVVAHVSHKLEPVELSQILHSDGTYKRARCKEKKSLKSAYPRLYSGEEYIAPGERAHASLSLSEKAKMEEQSLEAVADGKLSLDEFVDSLPLSVLADLTGGQPNRGIANTYGFGNQPEYGIPSAMTADGPAGLRILPQWGVYTTSWPCATAIASSWNVSMAEEVGKAIGAEVKENGFALYLAPAVNIHRSPLCGRNFEYYSEDPLIAGKMGAGMIHGVQTNGVGACIKHFALNNKETNRKNSDSRVSERAAREIYLRQFEIAIKEAKPAAVMSSYNIINGVRASENKELLSDILRTEWGFEGFVTTDWWTLGEQYMEIAAGNDLKMASGNAARIEEAVEKGLLSVDDLKASVRRILSFFLRFE